MIKRNKGTNEAIQAVLIEVAQTVLIGMSIFIISTRMLEIGNHYKRKHEEKIAIQEMQETIRACNYEALNYNVYLSDISTPISLLFDKTNSAINSINSNNNGAVAHIEDCKAIIDHIVNLDIFRKNIVGENASIDKLKHYFYELKLVFNSLSDAIKADKNEDLVVEKLNDLKSKFESIRMILEES